MQLYGFISNGPYPLVVPLDPPTITALLKKKKRSVIILFHFLVRNHIQMNLPYIILNLFHFQMLFIARPAFSGFFVKTHFVYLFFSNLDREESGKPRKQD